MCRTSKNWDKYLPALPFAIREVPQESLGFSSFELLYGRSFRCPMAILRKLWSVEVNDDQVLSTYQYVIDLRERLEQTCQLAHENLEKVQFKQNTYYDNMLDHINLTSGIRSCYYSQQRVLNCYSNGKIRMKWFEIVNRMDYRVDVNGVVGKFYANMLKQYVESKNVTSHCLLPAEANVTVDEETDTEEFGLDDCAFPTAKQPQL